MTLQGSIIKKPHWFDKNINFKELSNNINKGIINEINKH